jgi:hypothetical protein
VTVVCLKHPHIIGSEDFGSFPGESVTSRQTIILLSNVTLDAACRQDSYVCIESTVIPGWYSRSPPLFALQIKCWPRSGQLPEHSCEA